MCKLLRYPIFKIWLWFYLHCNFRIEPRLRAYFFRLKTPQTTFHIVVPDRNNIRTYSPEVRKEKEEKSSVYALGHRKTQASTDRRWFGINKWMGLIGAPSNFHWLPSTPSVIARMTTPAKDGGTHWPLTAMLLCPIVGITGFCGSSSSFPRYRNIKFHMSWVCFSFLSFLRIFHVFSDFLHLLWLPSLVMIFEYRTIWPREIK